MIHVLNAAVNDSTDYGDMDTDESCDECISVVCEVVSDVPACGNMV